MDIQGMCAEALEQVVREVAARVVASIKAQQDQALVVYTGAKIGYATATEQLAQLRERLGLSYTVLMSEPAARVLDVDAIDEVSVAGELYTAGLPDPELLIRTSGELRLSNFLLWQLAYSEFYVTDVLWPDFDRWELLRAIRSFQGRDRRFGGVSVK